MSDADKTADDLYAVAHTRLRVDAIADIAAAIRAARQPYRDLLADVRDTVVEAANMTTGPEREMYREQVEQIDRILEAK